jgi:hypothetical protein
MAKRQTNYPTLFVFRNPAGLDQALRKAADELGVSASEYARRAVADRLARDGFAA